MRRIYSAAIGMLAILSTGPSAAALGAPAAEVVPLPSYASVKDLDHYAAPAEYVRIAADRRFRMEKLGYKSDGLDVFAYLYRPVKPAKKMPVVIFNRGSWTWSAFAAEMAPMAHRLAERGYLVVAPMYRGSGGAFGRDEMGGADLDDLFNLLPLLRSIPYADMDHLYLYGESRGGMMVYQALRDGFPAKAAAVYGGFTDLDAMLQDPKWSQAGDAIWPDLNEHREQIVERRSALRWPERINAPILIMHGGRDQSVAPLQSLKMAEALARLGKPYELLIMEGENHVLSGRAAERDMRAADWFSRTSEAAAPVAK
jgi:dipeptidyl aminopeptidase/acylaminoacyl peptidase